MTAREKYLLDQLLGLQLLAKEISETVDSIRFHHVAGQDDEHNEALRRVAELLEPILAWRDRAKAHSDQRPVVTYVVDE